MRLAAIAAAAALALGFAAGWQAQAWRWRAEDADRLEIAAEAQRLQARREDGAAASHERDRAQLRAEFSTIYLEAARVVEKPVYRNVCLDADGLRILGDAIAGTGRPAGEPAPAVPAADGAR